MDDLGEIYELAKAVLDAPEYIGVTVKDNILGIYQRAEWAASDPNPEGMRGRYAVECVTPDGSLVAMRYTWIKQLLETNSVTLVEAEGLFGMTSLVVLDAEVLKRVVTAAKVARELKQDG